MNQPKFYNSDNKVIAVSTYAGKTVRGVAKCDPEDTFSLESGKELAAARLDERIAGKRFKRACRKFENARQALMEAQDYYDRMYQYYEDSAVKLGNARVNTADVLNKIAP